MDNSPEVKIAVLNNDIKHINDTLSRMEQKFDSAISGFVTFDKLADAQRAADAKHAEQDAAIKKLEDWNTWAVRIVLGAILTSGVGVLFIVIK